jgi:hypothetical protein
MTFNYTQNIPFASDAPANDQPIMEQNTNSTFGIINVDHVGFNLANGGYHTDIHMVPQLTDPPQILNIGQLYTKIVTFNGKTDAALFYRSGTTLSSSNSITQITAPKGTDASENGYAFLPGGIILQWGIIDDSPGNLPSGTTTPLLFDTDNIDFPNACFNVQMTLINDGSTNNAQVMSVRTGSVSNTGFSWNYTGGSAYKSFYWMAIGN